MNVTTHIATQIFKVDRYSFLQAMPKVGTPNDTPIWFVYVDGVIACTSSFATIEDAMRYAARPTREQMPAGGLTG